MPTNGPKNNWMQFDLTAGNNGLESSPQAAINRRLHDETLTVTLIKQAASCAAHGCCCENEWTEDAERWDGMS
jgi:hypothetical protein